MANELVLIVDDQADVRELIANRVLAPYGYRSIVAIDGRSGLQQAIKVHPDLIIFDMDMEGFSGLQILSLLRERGRNIPAIALVSKRTKPFSASSLCPGVNEYVCKPFGVEDVLGAIERALTESRLRRQLEQVQMQLQQQTRQQKMLYVIAQAVTSPLEYQQILNRLVEAAVFVTDADQGSLLLQDRESGALYVRALRANEYPHAQAANQEVHDVLAQQVIDSGESMALFGQDAVAAHAPVPALLQVPLKAQGRAIGVLRVSRLNPNGRFDKINVYMLSVLAGYAAIAIENTRLYRKIEGELERSAVYRISTAFGSTLRLESVLDMVVSEAIRLTTAERGYITLLDEASGLYVSYAMHGLDHRTIEGAGFRSGRYIVRRVLDQVQPVHTTIEDHGLAHSVQDGLAVICVPILGSSGALGAIYVDRRGRQNQFTSRQFDVLTMLSVHAAAAIENARLFSQIEAERRKLEAVIRGTDQPVIVTDVEGTVLLMNAAARQVFGTRRAMGTGMLLPHVIGDKNLKRLFQEAKSSGHVQHSEIPIQDDKTFSATVTPISGVGFVAVMQDITQLTELSRLKSEFVATVSHDLRSPLSTVLSLLDVLEHIGPLSQQQKDFIINAQQEIRRLIDLTSDLLDLGRLEADIDMEMKQCDLAHIVKQSCRYWQRSAQERDHTFDTDLPTEPVFVYGNATRLRQVIDNLLNNAIKYTPKGGQISVYLAQRGIQAVLRVQDSGIGIAAQDQPYVFDRFFRVRSEQTVDVQGTGLGLAIARSIVEKHQGRIWVESEPEQGSTFYATFPLAS